MALLTVIHIKKYGDCIFWLAQPLKSVVGIVWTRQLCSRWTTLSEFQDKINWTRGLQFACVRATQLQSAGGAKIIREASLLSLRSARNSLSSCQDQRGRRAWLVDTNKKYSSVQVKPFCQHTYLHLNVFGCVVAAERLRREQQLFKGSALSEWSLQRCLQLTSVVSSVTLPANCQWQAKSYKVC